MLVKEMIEAIKNKKLKVIDLAEKYRFSDRTIQTKIKNLGFEWDSVKGEYNFTGTDESVYELDIDNVFKKKARTSGKKDAKSEVRKAGKQVASTLQNFNDISPEINNENVVKKEVRKTNKRSSKKVTDKGSNKTNDNIDLLLSGKKVKRVHKGFYLDHDVLEIIENVDSGVRSDLVNECLRKVFKEKGLL
ncbi:hypothetical protein H7U05_30930 [Priestia megaterium]|uniref:hypothetical protein n=1 Tax=Priestia megaterium TaxID=1404 RepID=UPI001C8D2579|nr:hypothetical protein [Priestia megaterium]MBY0201614.1 hypothetical protein [Priestia megaterium]